MLDFFSSLSGCENQVLSSEPLFWSKIGARLGMWTRSVGFITCGGARAPPWEALPSVRGRPLRREQRLDFPNGRRFLLVAPQAPGAGRSSILLSNLGYYVLAVSLLLHIPWDTLAIDTLVVASSVKTSFAPGSAGRASHRSPSFPSSPSISTPSPRTLDVLTVMTHVFTLIIPTLLFRSPLEGLRGDHCPVFPFVATQSP